MSDEKWKRILKTFALISAAIALIEGILYFNPKNLGLWPYCVSIAQNAVHTFMFEADISAAEAYAFAHSGIPLISQYISYLYTLVVLVAPICSAVAVYSAVETLLRQKLNPFIGFRREPILIFGEHASLTAAITNEDSRKYHFYLITKTAVESQLELLRKETVVIKIKDYHDFDNNIELLKSKVTLKKVKRIIIAQNTMAETLTLYLWIAQLCKSGILPEVKVFALCNGFGGERILEEIYEHDIKKDGMPELVTYDSYEISARKLLAEHLPITKTEDVHAVLTGFTPLAQQFTTNLINQSVANTDGKIIIDIIDEKVETTQQLFARRFSPNYLQMESKRWTLPKDCADGHLELRFHKLDSKSSEYRQLLSTLYEKTGPFTFCLICLPNADECLSAMLEVRQIIKQKGGNEAITMGLRIDQNTMLAKSIEKEHPGIFTFDDCSGNVTLNDIFYETVDQKAKAFNAIYHSITLLSADETMSKQEAINTTATPQEDTAMESLWKKMQAFQRTSSRLLADHCSTKEILTDLPMLRAAIGENGSLLFRKGKRFLMYGDDADFLDRLAQNPEIEALAKIEHRRWCYAMAINGWSYAHGKKDTVLKTNPCLVPWEKLKDTLPNMCKYDLMPYMYLLLQADKTESPHDK